MIDVASFKLVDNQGVSEDEWDEDGKLQLTKKFVVDKEYKRILIKPVDSQRIVEFEEKPYCVHLNYNNYGYLRARNDAESQNIFIENLRYVENQATRTYIWRTFIEMVRTNDLPVKDWIRVV